jgi:hypothetical protein
MNKHKEFSLLKNLIDKHSIRDYLSKYYFLIEDIDHNNIMIHHVIFLNFKIHIFYSRNLIISNKILDNNKTLNQEQKKELIQEKNNKGKKNKELIQNQKQNKMNLNKFNSIENQKERLKTIIIEEEIIEENNKIKNEEKEFKGDNFHFSINIDFFNYLDIIERNLDNNIDKDIKVDNIYLIGKSSNNLINFLLDEEDNNIYEDNSLDLIKEEVSLEWYEYINIGIKEENKKNIKSNDGLYLSFSFINFNKKLYEELLQLIKSHND